MDFNRELLQQSWPDLSYAFDAAISPGAVLLLSGAEIDAFSPETQPVEAAGCSVLNLKRNRPLHLRIAGCAGKEQFMIADVHYMKIVSGEADAIGARHQSVVAKAERNLGQQISLVLFLDTGGITRGIDEGRQD